MTGDWRPADYTSQPYTVNLDGELVVAFETAYSFHDPREWAMVYAFKGGALDGRRVYCRIEDFGLSFEGWVAAQVKAVREETHATTASDSGGSRAAPA